MKTILFSSALLTTAAHQQASASVIYTVSGISTVGTEVSFEADLSISGDFLTLKLTNTSVASLAPDDTLASFYFDIFNGIARPDLIMDSATGDVYTPLKSSADTLSRR